MAIIYERAVKEDLDLGTGTVTRSNPAGGQMTGHQINLASLAIAAEYSIDVGLVDPTLPVAFDESVPGTRLGDHAEATFDGAWDDRLELTARVIANDSVRIVVYNHGQAAFNPGAGTLRILVFRIP